LKAYPTIEVACLEAGLHLQKMGQVVDNSRWQGITNVPEMIEDFGFSFKCPMPPKQHQLATMSGADMPWAENHFQERVSGIPSNPGYEYQNWPFYVNKEREDSDFRGEQGTLFTHTYQERFWPQYAKAEGMGYDGHDIVELGKVNHGIRYRYGDLDDVINHLWENPTTRQAYFPIWFPEDTGVVHGGRVPCSLGYLFNIKGDYLHITYYIRSCDYMRHFRNDVYFTARLAQFVCERLNKTGNLSLVPGFMFFHIASFHILATDKLAFDKKLKELCEKRDTGLSQKIGRN